MLSVETARRRILAKMKPLPVQPKPLLEALGCVLAEDITASEPLPPFTNSAMDGYAVRFFRHPPRSLAEHPSSSNNRMDSPPVTAGNDGSRIYLVVDTVPAGSCSKRSLAPGEAVRIMTGAPLPDGADAVVPIEETTPHPYSLSPLGGERVGVRGVVRQGQHIRPQGEEVQPGEKLFSSGRVLRPADVGLLSSLGWIEVSVIAKPRVAVITTGSEIVDAWVKPKAGQLRNANLPAIVACLKEAGYPMVYARHVADNPAELEAALSSCPADVLITCGGVSVGDYDLVKTAIAQQGEIYFWKVAIKPGKPFVFGRLKKTPSPLEGEGGGEGYRPWVFGLPGNPVSALVAFEILVKPALRALAGHRPESPSVQMATLSKPVRHKPGRREYVRARVRQNGKGLLAKPLCWQGSGMLRSLTEANAWIIVPEDSQTLQEGSPVEVLMR